MNTIRVQGSGGLVLTIDDPYEGTKNIHAVMREKIEKGQLIVLEDEPDPKPAAKKAAAKPAATPGDE